MPPKKKPTAKKAPAWVAKDLELTIHELAGTREKLAEANEQIKSGEVALLETAKMVRVLNRGLTVERAKLVAAQARDDEHLAATHKMVEDHRKFRAEDSAETEHWEGEVTRLTTISLRSTASERGRRWTRGATTYRT